MSKYSELSDEQVVDAVVEAMIRSVHAAVKVWHPPMVKGMCPLMGMVMEDGSLRHGPLEDPDNAPNMERLISLTHNLAHIMVPDVIFLSVNMLCVEVGNDPGKAAAYAFRVHMEGEDGIPPEDRLYRLMLYVAGRKHHAARIIDSDRFPTLGDPQVYTGYNPLRPIMECVHGK